MTEETADLEELRRASKEHVFHFGTNYAALDALYETTFPRFIERGEGSYLFDEDGTKLLDGGHHLGACSVGHGVREIAEAIGAQAGGLEYSSLEAGLTHRAVAGLALKLAEILPLDRPMIQFTSSGSEAVEAAVKLARGYQRARGKTGKYKIVARAGSYHGSSYAGMTLTGNAALREAYMPGVPGVVRVIQPSPYRCDRCTPERMHCIEEIERIFLDEGPDSIAAFIAEPVSVHQSIKVPHEEYWPALRDLCDKYDVLLIADEVVCGFGRLGTMFGVERFGVRPDMMTLAKGISSGYVPLGAVAVSRFIVDAMQASPFVHINTYSGHPVACVAALETIKILERDGVLENVLRMERVLGEEARRIEEHPAVGRVSVIGAMASVEFPVPDYATGSRIAMQLRHACYRRGVLARSGSDATLGAMWFMPPLTATEEEAREGMRVYGEAIAEILGAPDAPSIDTPVREALHTGSTS